MSCFNLWYLLLKIVAPVQFLISTTGFVLNVIIFGEKNEISFYRSYSPTCTLSRYLYTPQLVDHIMGIIAQISDVGHGSLVCDNITFGMNMKRND